MISLKFSNRVEMADRILDDLVADSRGALLFFYWAAAMNLSQLPIRPGVSIADESDAQQRTAAVMATGLFATPWLREAPLATPLGLADPAAAIAALEQAAGHLVSDAGSIDAPWGQLARLKVGTYDEPASGGPGDPVGIFNALPLPFGLTLIGKGEEEDGDQLPLLMKGELRPTWRTRAEIEAHLEEREELTSGSG